jgi:hypothetical protein
MATTSERAGDGVKDRQAQEQRQALIGGHVLRVLGRPEGLWGVQVRRLWADHYRVNVFVGVDASSGRVAHSYFLETDGAGNVVAATPPITRQYE